MRKVSMFTMNGEPLVPKPSRSKLRKKIKRINEENSNQRDTIDQLQQRLLSMSRDLSDQEKVIDILKSRLIAVNLNAEM